MALPVSQKLKSKRFRQSFSSLNFSGLAGEAALGASSIFSPTLNPGLAGGLAAASAVIGPGLQYAARGPVGVFANLLIQMNAGPLQAGIESRLKERK